MTRTVYFALSSWPPSAALGGSGACVRTSWLEKRLSAPPPARCCVPPGCIHRASQRDHVGPF
eukprot:3714931-Pyramimonas_sp.AAC.1